MNLGGLRRALSWGLLAVASIALAACQDEAAKLAQHQERGDAYLEDEKYAEAILEYKNVLQIDPNHADAHYGLAKAYIGNEQLRHAYWELQETVRLDPENLDARLEYGGILLFGKEDELEEAVGHADHVIAADETRTNAWLLKGRALHAMKQHGEAEAAYAKAMEMAPEDPGPVLLLANLHRGQGEPERAEPLYRKLTALEPGVSSFVALASFLALDGARDDEAEAAYRRALELAEPERVVAAYSLFANFLYARERFGDAEAVLREGIEASDDDLDLLYTLARFYNARGEVAKADAMMLEAAKAKPDDPQPHLLLSAYRGRQGDLEAALEAAEAALSVDPDSHLARLRKAELLVDLGFRNDDNARIARGRAIVDAVLAGDSGNPEALLVKAKIELARQQFAEAETSLRQALDSRADWAQAHFLLGSALFLQRDYVGSRAEMARALEIDADLIDAQRMMARIHAALGDDELAVNVGAKVLQRQPDAPKLRILMAQSLVRLGRIEQASAHLEQIPSDQRDAEAFYAQGRLQYLAGNRESARASFLRAYEQDPHRYEVLRALLDLDVRENRVRESAERVGAAVAERPEDSRLAQLAGEVALYSGNASEAEHHFSRAIELNPNDLAAYENLARYLMVTGRPNEVLGTYEKALAENPDSGTLHLIVGSLYELRARPDKAMERYEEAVRLDPGLAVAKNNLAYLLAENGGNLDRALDLAQEAKEMLPDNPNAADTLGWVLYKKDVPTAAVGYLREAERGFKPDDPQLGVVRHHLALAQEANGEKDEARETLARALRDLEALRAQQDPPPPEPAWASEARAMLERLGAPVASAAASEG